MKESAFPAVAGEPKLPGSFRHVMGICFLLSVLIFAVYGQTFWHEFVNYDDGAYVYENPLVTNGLSLQSIQIAFTHKDSGLWDPLVVISHVLNWQLFGNWAGGHHVANVLLHLGSTLLLFFLLRQMTGTLWRSALVAALFAVHPLRAESVAWIAERKDVLSGLFFMLTLGGYLHYVRRPHSLMRYSWVLFLFALGLMSKVMLVTLPCVLLLLDYWPLHRLFRHSDSQKKSSAWSLIHWRVIAEKIPLLILSLVLCIITLADPEKSISALIEPIPFWIRMALAPVWLVIYIGQMICPVGLAVIYPDPTGYLPWSPAALILFAVLSLVAFLLRSKHPYLWMGWLWNFGMLVPVLGIFQISRHSMADHYNYLPQIGLYIALVWFMSEWAEKRHLGVWFCTGTIAMLVALTLAAYHQAAVWKDNTTLWTATFTRTRDNYLAHNNLATWLLAQKETEAAIAEYHKALEIKPDIAETHNYLGVLFAGQMKTEQAIAEFREALRIDPTFSDSHNNLGKMLEEQNMAEAAITEYRSSIRSNSYVAQPHYNLGRILAGQGRTEEATAEYHEALRLNPFYAEAHNNLGFLLKDQKKLAEAITEFREALRIRPDYALAHNNLGRSLLHKGAEKEALLHLERAYFLQPENYYFQGDLALALATTSEKALRDLPKAMHLALEANRATLNSAPPLLRTLAAVYAQSGNFPKAVATAKTALLLTGEQESLGVSLRNDIKLYQSARSFGSN